MGFWLVFPRTSSFFKFLNRSWKHVCCESLICRYLFLDAVMTTTCRNLRLLFLSFPWNSLKLFVIQVGHILIWVTLSLANLGLQWSFETKVYLESWTIFATDLLVFISMTTLLMHTVAHSTKPSFMPKTNNQPHKKFLSLALSWAKVVKNGKILTFKVNFLCQKISESF